MGGYTAEKSAARFNGLSRLNERPKVETVLTFLKVSDIISRNKYVSFRVLKVKYVASDV